MQSKYGQHQAWLVHRAALSYCLLIRKPCESTGCFPQEVKPDYKAHQHTLLRAQHRNCLESGRDFSHLYAILQSMYAKGKKPPEASYSVRPFNRKFIHFTPTQQRIHSNLFTTLTDRIKLRVQIPTNRSRLRKATFC